VILTCPICAGREFEDFNCRSRARCSRCGSLERGRYQWLIYKRMISLPTGATVAHFAPERFFMDHFGSRPDIQYRAFDKYPEHYRHDRVSVAALDLCTDRAAIPSESFDLILHSHVLEHLPCAFEPVLTDMKRMLKPGGVMLFSVPIDGETTTEGLDPAQNDVELALRARQGEHLRIFGRADFASLVTRILGADCLLHQRDHFTEQELSEANIPIARRGEPTGKSIFLYRKP
jgi:SAM-dependent methyltransferase